MDQNERKILEFLFESAKEDSNKHYDIKPTAGKDALMIANKLLKAGLIKDDIQGDATTVACSISIDGIRAVDPAFVDTKVNQFLDYVDRAEAIYNVVDILGLQPKQFQLCFDLAIYIQNQDLGKLLYALYPKKVMLETTLLVLRAKS